MGRFKLDQETWGLTSLMEKLTHARVKDCIKDNDVIYFIVDRGEMGKALGKNGSKVKKVEQEVGKKVKLIEYNPEVTEFVKNIISPIKVNEITLVDGAVQIQDPNRKTKSLLIGRDGKNLDITKRAVRRFFDVDVKIEG